MVRKGRPIGAKSGPRPKMWWCSWGTPSAQTAKAYADESGARNKATTELRTMKEWADKYNKQMSNDLAVCLDEVRHVTILREKREWGATDEHTGTTFVVRLWKET